MDMKTLDFNSARITGKFTGIKSFSRFKVKTEPGPGYFSKPRIYPDAYSDLLAQFSILNELGSYLVIEP